MSGAVPEERREFLSTLPAGDRDRRLALAVVLASGAVFLLVAPFATVALTPVPAFLPAYQSALVISDVITAVLLYGQYNILRSRALLLLASGYLFCAFMAISHLLSFPGLFAPAACWARDPRRPHGCTFSGMACFRYASSATRC